jgi:hypothetical protein
VAWHSYSQTYQKVSVTLDPNAGSADIYLSEGEGHAPSSDKPVISISSSREVKLKRDDYVLVTKPNADYGSQTLFFSLNNGKVSLDVKPNYSQQKLISLLAGEQDAINNSYAAKYQRVGGYSLQNGQLFKDGAWYGGLVVPLSGGDTLRIVMQKKDGKWTVVTDPPEIVLSSVVYPDIPKEILQALNSL